MERLHKNCLACQIFDPTPEEIEQQKKDLLEFQKWWDDRIMEALKIYAPEFVKKETGE